MNISLSSAPSSPRDHILVIPLRDYGALPHDAVKQLIYEEV